MLMLPYLFALGGSVVHLLKGWVSVGHGWFSGTTKQQEIDINS